MLIVTGGIRIAANRYAPIGAIINTQAEANNLFEVPKEKTDFSEKVIKVNVELSKVYDLKFSDTHCSCGLCCNHSTLIHKHSIFLTGKKTHLLWRLRNVT